MSLVVVGTNYKCSPLDLREQLSFSKKERRQGVEFLKQESYIQGAVILSTCNRVEIYAETYFPDLTIERIENFLSEYKRVHRNLISPFLYRYEGKQVLRHLIAVTCGLDSLILGETQIKSQVKKAYSISKQVSFTGRFLEKAFTLSFKQAKRVHNETKISEGKVSVGSVTFDFIKKKMHNLNNKKVLIIGVGKVSELVLKHIKKENPQILFIANRTFNKAKKMAANMNLKASRFNNLKEDIQKADLIVSATASPHFIIKKDYIPEKRNKPLLIIDLAMPRDIQPEISEFDNVHLFSLEDMNVVIENNLRKKEEESKRANQIIDSQIDEIWEEFIRLEKKEVVLH